MTNHSPARRRGPALLITAALTGALALAPSSAFGAIVADPPAHSAPDAALSLTPIGSYETGVFDESAAEIVQAWGDRLFVVNAQAGAVDVLDYSDPTAITRLFSLESAGVANSVAIRADGLGVIAFEAPVKTDPGHLMFFDASAADAASALLGSVTVGALPDMVTVSPDGAYAVVANEGEPAEDFSIDPEGSISVVTLPSTTTAPAQSAVRTADFHAFEGDALPDGVRVFGPTPHGGDLPVSRNLEPEYLAVDGGTAYASLQEANAFAVVDLATATVTDILPLGRKDHGLTENALDPSDRDGGYNLRAFPGALRHPHAGRDRCVHRRRSDVPRIGERGRRARVGRLRRVGAGEEPRRRRLRPGVRRRAARLTDRRRRPRAPERVDRGGVRCGCRVLHRAAFVRRPIVLDLGHDR